MQVDARNPYLERINRDPRTPLRLWVLVSYCVLLAGGYLHFETGHAVLGRLLVTALAIVLFARLALYLWSLYRLSDAHPPTQLEFDAHWARLREQRRRDWIKLESRGRRHYVWKFALNLTPLLVGPFFGMLVLVGPEYLQIGSNPTLSVNFWGALAVAVLAALPIVIIFGVRGWNRAAESWRQLSLTPSERHGPQESLDRPHN